MNRRLLPVLALVAVVGLGGVLGLYGALPDGAGAAPEDPTETPTGTPADPAPASLTTAGDSLTLSTATEQVVRGESTLEAGTTLTVRLKSTDSSQPFIRSAEATVTENGTFRTTFDLSTIEGNGTFVAVVRHDGSELVNTTGQLEVVESGEPGGTDDADTSATLLTGDGDRTLETVDGERVRGETDLEPGTNLTIRLRSSSENPFLVSTGTTVGEDGTFEARLNLGHLDAVENGTEVDLLVLADGETLVNDTATMVQTGPTETERYDDGENRTEGPFVRVVTVDGGEMTVANATEQVVRGETDLEPGTTLTVRLRSSGESPFLYSESATVTEDGTFRAAFDLSSVEAPARFEAAVVRDAETLATANGSVVSNATAPTAELDVEGDRLTLANATGQVVTGDTSVAPGETVLVRIHGAGESPFIQSREATVTEDGTFRATFDLSEMPADATFRVYVQHDGERLTYAPGEFGAD